jgi:PQQ-dependent dehydrogenase (methanol/ethanol family)
MKYLPLLFLLATACSADPRGSSGPLRGDSDGHGAGHAGPANVEWPVHGNNNEETRFSELDDINVDNVADLGLAWHYDYPTHRGLEATPLVVEGVIYTTASWSTVFAHDARNGALLWSYNPQVPREWAVHLCCDVVNRGVAYAKGSVYFGTLDGRLIKLHAGTGKLQWQVQTTDTALPYSITGAPRIVGNRVIVGNGGGEFGVRGYVSAYAADSGDLDWRFYTVPGNPADGFESEAMQMAADTWRGGQWWKVGGGGTVWDSMAYDPELNLLYVGVGNGSPWNRQIRSPGGGDNLFLSSILAIDPDSGRYVWHYQTTPGESWDYTATQHLILTDLEWNGVVRKVIMQAPKNGFFYVLDRRSGELLSAEPYATVTWATHVDRKTGRPVESEGARYEAQATGLHFPGPIGAHNWHPMSYSPETGLVYIPSQDVPWVYAGEEDFRHRPGYWNTGTDARYAGIPDEPDLKAAVLASIKGSIVAWDPVKGAPRWTVEHEGPWNGGLLSTAGNLVFQGNSVGEVVAYRADSGQRLWSFFAQTGVVAPPVTYRLDGEQYVAVVAGWGGILPLIGGESITSGPIANHSRLLVFKLNGQDRLPAYQPLKTKIEAPPASGTVAQIAAGRKLYLDYCVFCHGDGAVGGGVIPDLRALTLEKHAIWDAIVLGGSHWQGGMVGFGKVLTRQQSDNIHFYVNSRAEISPHRK